MKIILDLCGGTGSWSNPYKDNGYDVRLITMDNYDVEKWRQYPEILKPIESGEIYGILAAPPCTHFSFARSTGKTPRNLRKAMATVKACLEIIWECQYRNLPSDNAKRTSLTFWAIENPYGLLRRFLGEPTAIVQPWMWGDMYQKKTCLWGFFNKPVPKITEYKTTKFDKLHVKDLPKLPYDYILPKEYIGNHRAAMRAVTPHGFAKAFYKANL